MTRATAEIERELEAANRRVERAVAALAPKHKGGEMEEFRASVDQQLRLQRELALAKGQETALELDWQPAWDTGAPLPHVVSSGLSTYLIYLVSTPDPNWDGTFVRVVDPSTDGSDELIAIVKFARCYAYKFGGPNDEVISGHPLYGRGLVAYRAHQIANSNWIEAEKRINSVHRGFRPESWDRLKHYLLVFHDDCFECLAENHSVEVIRATFRQALECAVEHVVSRS